MYTFLVALQFLTRLPSPIRNDVSLEDLGRSIAWFPVVGLLLGTILVGIDASLGAVLAAPVVNALLLGSLVLITGALHLDGVVDAVDGLASGPDAGARLAAMHRSVAGAPGAIAGCLMLLGGYAALSALGPPSRTATLLLAPMLGRLAILLGYWLYPYGRDQLGLSRALKDGATRGRALAGLIFATAAAAAIGGPAGLGLLVLAVALMHGFASFALRRLPGLTGDVHGAICETAQLGVIAVAPFVLTR